MNAFRMTPDEIQRWERDGYFVRENVFAYEENDHLRQVAEDIVAGKRRMPMAHIDRNALIRDGKDARSGIYGMHKIHHPSCFIPEFLARVRDPRPCPSVSILHCLGVPRPRARSAPAGDTLQTYPWRGRSRQNSNWPAMPATRTALPWKFHPVRSSGFTLTCCTKAPITTVSDLDAAMCRIT